jgi:hypothetical protein
MSDRQMRDSSRDQPLETLPEAGEEGDGTPRARAGKVGLALLGNHNNLGRPETRRVVPKAQTGLEDLGDLRPNPLPRGILKHVVVVVVIINVLEHLRAAHLGA